MPCTVTTAFAARATDEFSRVLAPMVILWVASDPPIELTVIEPTVALLLRFTVALSKDKEVTELGILTSKFESPKLVSKKLPVEDVGDVELVIKGLNVQSLTEPGKIAVRPSCATTILASTMIVLMVSVSIPPEPSSVVIVNVALPLKLAVGV